MEALNQIPAFIRDFGLFVTVVMAFMFLLAYSPFAFRITGEYSFTIGRNATLKQIAEVASEQENP